MNPGLHLVHKPVGPTSFSLVQNAIASVPPGAKRQRICHGGTLDPFASGLLLILVGPATRLFDHLHAIPKTYIATVRWGVETDNGDPTGQSIVTGDPSSLTPRALEHALAPFMGWHEQTAPATSAKRIAGERAYAKAHRGEAVELPPSRVYLHEAHWITHHLPDFSTLNLVVRGGFYVRALARDLGRQLGCGAHLAALHRSAIGPWQDPGLGQTRGVHGRDLLPWARSRELNDAEVGDLRQNRPIPVGELREPDWPLPAGFPGESTPIRGYHLGRLLFLLHRQDGRLNVRGALGKGLS